MAKFELKTRIIPPLPDYGTRPRYMASIGDFYAAADTEAGAVERAAKSPKLTRDDRTGVLKV